MNRPFVSFIARTLVQTARIGRTKTRKITRRNPRINPGIFFTVITCEN